MLLDLREEPVSRGDAGKLHAWKTVENERGCGPPISSPKIEVRGKKISHSSVSRPLERSTAADPSETPAVGRRDADQ